MRIKDPVIEFLVFIFIGIVGALGFFTIVALFKCFN